jgi:polyhydroxyalkanoate synthesis regulator phasin
MSDSTPDSPQPPQPQTQPDLGQPDQGQPDLGDWFTRTRHIFYGTASSLVEMLQDPQKRTENLNKLSLDLGELADELAAKGALTEAEALEYVEQLRTLQSQPAQDPGVSTGANNQQAPVTIDIQDAETMPPESSPADPKPTEPVTSDPSNRVSQADIQALMDLTRQVESLRLDLERARTDPPSTSTQD